MRHFSVALKDGTAAAEEHKTREGGDKVMEKDETGNYPQCKA
jgi:hypothetical protein